MARWLTKAEIIALHERVIESSGGSHGVRDLGAVEAAVAQPFASFGGHDLYPTFSEKVCAVGAALIQNHPFVDGNKRIGHAALEVTLVLNGYEIEASVDDQERTVLALAAGEMTREAFTAWYVERIVPRTL